MSKQFTWEEIRNEIMETVRNLEDNLEEGVIRRFDLQQDFDANADYAVVLSSGKYNNILLDLVREAREGTPVDNDWSPGCSLKRDFSSFQEDIVKSIDWLKGCWDEWSEFFPVKWSAMTYKPQPIDTTNVEPPEEITELTEKLAKSTHDIWAQNRLDQGWTYGKYRDDEEKRHPCLVHYENLPEGEKKFDRDTAMETLKAIYALGYRIVK